MATFPRAGCKRSAEAAWCGPVNAWVVAVSGGADSVLLLALMTQHARALGLVVSAVHFNHHLRGAESDEDERFVREFAERLGVAFMTGGGDVARRAREMRRNLEATARELRYRFFLALIREGRLDKVSTAHTANDQAETVLLRLIRGTGTRGLAGIYPSLDGNIIRPLLGLTRPEVEDELRRRGLAFRTDSSNRDLRLRRNKVRTELLPRLQGEFNPAIVPLLASLADRSRDDEGYLDQQAHERAEPWRVREGTEEKFPVRALAELPPALARRIIRQMILAVSGRLTGISHRHIESIFRLATEIQSGRRVVLPGNIEARHEFDWVIVAPQAPQADSNGYSFIIRPPTEIDLPQLGVVLSFKIVEGEGIEPAYNEIACVRLDAEKLAGDLELRSWRPGDRFCPSPGRKSLKLKELFRWQKIGAASRRCWPVLVAGGEIVWVWGLRVESSVVPGKKSGATLIIQEALRKVPVSRQTRR